MRTFLGDWADAIVATVNIRAMTASRMWAVIIADIVFEMRVDDIDEISRLP
jgi:hypothetical protein